MTASSHPVLPDGRPAAGVARLAVRHQGRYPAETIQRLIADSYEQLAAHAHVRAHLVVQAERFAAERLDALAQVENPTGVRPRVLFVCSHNAGRSQMAAARLAHRAGDDVIVSSAGTHPSGAVDPQVVQAFTEAGIELDEVSPQAADRRCRPGRRHRDRHGLWRHLSRGARPPLPGLTRPGPRRRPGRGRALHPRAIHARITTLLDTLPGN